MSEPTPESSAAAKDPKVIKRYTNRKLYDTVESRYVTLDEIAEMVKQGAEVKIVDNRSKEDLTSVTLAQIIFEEEKKKNRMPLSVLREIIRHPGDLVSGFIEKEVSPRVASFREEAESRIDRLLRREGTKGEETGEPDAQLDAVDAAAADSSPGTLEALKASQRIFEDWQRKLDERVKQIVENVVGNLPAFGRDFQALIEKLDALEKKVDELEKK
jgi:polyhydroxyalkanoate synthesis repressor PhaR